MKTCFKCLKSKERSEFYKHPQMGDGLLGKCKECTKKDVADRASRKSNDPKWVESERLRHKEKSKRYTASGQAKKANQRMRNRQRRFPEDAKFFRFDFGDPEVKKLAHAITGNAIRDGKLIKKHCEVCSAIRVEAHHEDYSKPLDVVWLCKKHHTDRHIHLNAMTTLGRPILPIQEFISEIKKTL